VIYRRLRRSRAPGPCPTVFADERDQLLGIDGLFDGRSDRQWLHERVETREGAQRHDGDVTKGAIGLLRSAKLDAVHTRHVNIEHDEARSQAAVPEGVECLAPIPRCVRAHAVQREEHRDRVTHVGVVIDHENGVEMGVRHRRRTKRSTKSSLCRKGVTVGYREVYRGCYTVRVGPISLIAAISRTSIAPFARAHGVFATSSIASVRPAASMIENPASGAPESAKALLVMVGVPFYARTVVTVAWRPL
jgi:hypothetical protein